VPPSKKPQHRSKNRWHFGIRSKCPAWEVMLEIYRSLKNVGMVRDVQEGIKEKHLIPF
jgi:carbon catabolite-derepressing protein kinase